MIRALPALLFALFVGCTAETPLELPSVEPSADLSDVAVDANPPLHSLVRGDRALDYVNPMIGTGGLGFAYAGMTPAVQMPLGFVRVGPDTTQFGSHSASFYHFSGYYAEDPHIRGFSHTHLVGTGTTDYGNLRIAFAPLSDLDRPPRRWWLTKSVDSEVAEPGYYKVESEEGVVAELTAGHHSALHRYTVPRGVVLAVDPTASADDDGVLESDIRYADGRITGRVLYRGDYVGRSQSMEVRFEMSIEPRPTETFAWDGQEFVEGAVGTGTETAIAMRWASDAKVLLRVGISLISQQNAARRLAEVEASSFAQMREDNRAAWAELLDRIQIAGGSPTEREIFYTALYNCFRMPSRLDEYGEYPGIDGQTHAVDHAYYTDLSLWDTYRTLHPLWTVIASDHARDAMRSLILMAKDGGYLPRWPAGLSYTNGMEGDSAAILLAEGASKGIEGVDYATAFEMLLDTASTPVPDEAAYAGRGGIEDYLELGWVAADRNSNGASNTLEYAVDDNALAELAAVLGRPEEAEFRRRAKSYRNVWDPETRFFRPRNADGTFVEPFAERKFEGRGGDFAEGTAWHYRFYVTHDPSGLIELFGGSEAFVVELDTFMERSKLFEGDPALLFLPDPYYWHTNQPSLHAPFLYGPAGRWDKLEHWVAQIRQKGYFARRDGLVGNDDGGTLSAWYVLASIGIYPVVGTDRWLTFTPAFDTMLLNGREPAWGDVPGELHHAELF